MSELIKSIPLVALRGMTLLPSMIVHFDISRAKSIQAVEKAMLRDQKVFVVTQKNPEVSDPEAKDLYRIGTVVLIKQVIKMPKNIFRVLAEGLERAELTCLSEENGALWAEVMTFSPEQPQDIDAYSQEAMLRGLKDIFTEYSRVNPKLSKEMVNQLLEISSLEKLVDQIAINIPLYYEQKQKLLEAVELSERFDVLCTMLANEVEVIRVKNQIQEKVKARIDKSTFCGNS